MISLTSYPARFGSLHLTLGCLLDQTVAADRIVLWIADEDVDALPTHVRELERRGLQISTCDDLRSFKKLIPALQAYPNAYIVTADDDVYYRPDWLEMLVAGAVDEKRTVICHRAHRLRRQANDRIAPYAQWQRDVRDLAARSPSADLVPTGVGGVLYPPGALDRSVCERAQFERLCPNGDDLWFFWMARAAGTRHKKVGPKFWQISWASTQASALWASNEAGGNDAMIAALEKEFGYVD
jgi:hypothetical protein